MFKYKQGNNSIIINIIKEIIRLQQLSRAGEPKWKWNVFLLKTYHLHRKRYLVGDITSWFRYATTDLLFLRRKCWQVYIASLWNYKFWVCRCLIWLENFKIDFTISQVCIENFTISMIMSLTRRVNPCPLSGNTRQLSSLIEYSCGPLFVELYE